MLVAALVIFFLILLTGLYVAAEFAAVGARRSRLRRLAEDGNALAARILPVVEDAHELDRYIAVSQVGITLSSLILGAYGQATLAPALAPLLQSVAGLDADAAESTAAAIVLLTLTVLAMIVGELVPKSLALQDPTRMAIYTVLPMQWSLRLFSWAIVVLNGSGALLLRLLRVPSTGHRHVHSPEEIELLIAESRDGGLLEPRGTGAPAPGAATRPAHRQPADGAARTARGDRHQHADRRGARRSSPPARSAACRCIAATWTTSPACCTSRTSSPSSSRARTAARWRRCSGRSSACATTCPPIGCWRSCANAGSHQALVVDAVGRVIGLITLEDVVAELLGGVADEFKTARRRPPRGSREEAR